MIHLVVTLIVVGILLYLVNTYVPMDDKIKKILNLVVLVCVVFWLLYSFGIWSHADDVPVPKLT